MKTLFLSLIICALLVYVSHKPTTVTIVIPFVIDTTKHVTKQNSIRPLMKAIAKIESRNNPRARRFEPAIYRKLRKQSARTDSLMATSWGKYQIMGLHYRSLGYTSVSAFVRAMKRVSAQDSAFTRFVALHKLQPLIEKKQYSKFAAKYNGSHYKRNRYDTKLIAALK